MENTFSLTSKNCTHAIWPFYINRLLFMKLFDNDLLTAEKGIKAGPYCGPGYIFKARMALFTLES